MRSERRKQTLKLRLLAFVLDLALVWYSLNPAPAPIIRRNREDELPDEKIQNAEPQAMTMSVPTAISLKGAAAASLPLPEQDVDDFEWPEFIDG